MQKIDKTDTLRKILSGRRFTVGYFQWKNKQKNDHNYHA